jgi:hypothetical protein
MNQKSSIMIPGQGIIVPSETGGMSTLPMTRRNLLQRGGSLAVAAAMPMAISGAGLLLPATAQAADETVKYTNVRLRLSELVKDSVGAQYSMKTYTTDQGETFTFFEPKTNGGSWSGTRRHKINNVWHISHYHNCRIIFAQRWRRTIQYSNLFLRNTESYIFDHDQGRSLASFDWHLPNGAMFLQEYASGSEFNSNTVMYCKYAHDGFNYVKAEILSWGNNTHSWIATGGMRGADFYKYFDLFNKWHAAALGAKSRHGTLVATRVVAGVSFVLTAASAAGLALPTGGTSMMVLGALAVTSFSAFATAGNTLATDAIATHEAYRNLGIFMESLTGTDLVR